MPVLHRAPALRTALPGSKRHADPVPPLVGEARRRAELPRDDAANRNPGAPPHDGSGPMAGAQSGNGFSPKLAATLGASGAACRLPGPVAPTGAGQDMNGLFTRAIPTPTAAPIFASPSRGTYRPASAGESSLPARKPSATAPRIGTGGVQAANRPRTGPRAMSAAPAALARSRNLDCNHDGNGRTAYPAAEARPVPPPSLLPPRRA